MKDYNFLNLSPYEFEILTRDLLQKHLDCYVESFTSGADNGIDLRCSLSGKTIIQCKRYKNISSLIDNLEKEVDKVLAQKPDRYIVVTSVELNPQRKDKILELFKPYILTTENIFGKGDLNNLLTQHPEVETSHFKLWLSSTNVLQQIINRNIVNQSNFVLDDIKSKVKVYVQNESFFEASRLLKEEKYVIISGIPGIGKTTLAEIIVYDLLAKGVEDFIYLSDSIQNGYKMFSEEKSQIFLFDDFLGRNFLENSITTNDESLIVKFISKIQRSKNKYLVFTTREYILKQAKQKFDLLDSQDFVKCIIDLSKYTKLVKAKILYNHLFFNQAPLQYVREIRLQKFLSKVIEHKNYNPRIIETFTQKKLWEKHPPENFPNILLDLFENPESVWKHAFENTISQNARIVMFVFLVHSNDIPYNELYNSTINFSERFGEKYEVSFNSLNFKKSIKELEDTFISINRKNGKEPIINYQNPSIQDFLVNYVNEDEALKEDLIKSTTYLDLTLRLFSNNSTINGRHHLTMSSQISQSLERKIYSDFDTLEYKGYSWQNIKSKDDITVMKLSSIKAHMKSNHGGALDSFVIDKLKGIIYSKKISSSVQSYIELIYKYHKQLDIDLEPILRHLVGVIEDYDELMEFANLRKINEDVYDSFFKDNTEDCDKMIDGIIELLYSSATDNYTETIEQLENIESEFGHSVDDKVLEFRAKMEEIEFNSDIDYDAWKDQKAEREYGISEDKMINELFDSYE
jgi:hypothetical protein